MYFANVFHLNFFTESINRKRKLEDMVNTERMWRKRKYNEMMNNETVSRRQTVRYPLRRIQANAPIPTAASMTPTKPTASTEPTAPTEHEQDNAYIANMLTDIDYGSADFL